MIAENLGDDLGGAEEGGVLDTLGDGDDAGAGRDVGRDAFPGIESTEGVCGGAARVVRTRIPVWTLETYRRLGWDDERLLANFPTLRPADLTYAWLYVSGNQREIEQAIREQEEA